MGGFLSLMAVLLGWSCSSRDDVSSFFRLRIVLRASMFSFNLHHVSKTLPDASGVL
jgi:hypothetical protein